MLSRVADELRAQVPPRGPMRTLSAGAFVTALGDGAWYTVWAIYFTRVAGLSAAEFGLGFSIAGVVALMTVAPAGRLADRVGPRRVLVVLYATTGVAMLGFAFVDSFWPFLAVALVMMAAEQSATGVHDAYVLCLSKGQEQFDSLARQRAARSTGFALGAAFGGVVLAAGADALYLGLIAANAATSILYAGLFLRLPEGKVPEPASGERARKMRVFRDRHFVTVISLTSVLALCWGMMSTGVPLWIVGETDAPRAMIAVLVFMNAAIIAVGQLRFSRGSGSPRLGARRAMLSGTLLAASCLVFAASAGGGGPGVVTILLVGGLVHVAGELLFVAALWGLSVGLMAKDAPGEYQGFAATGTATAQVAAPVVMVLLIDGLGAAGWLVLAAVFLSAGLAARAATGAALRARGRRPATPIAGAATAEG